MIINGASPKLIECEDPLGLQEFFALDNMQEKYQLSHFDKNNMIYFEGSNAHCIYLVAKGSVKIARYNENGEELIDAIAVKGELFGEMVLFGESERTSFAVAMENGTKLYKMNLRVAQKMLCENKAFQSTIFYYIGAKARKLERRIQAMTMKETFHRVNAFILGLAEDGQRTDQGIEVHHPYTQKDMADLIGSSRQTVCKCLNELKRKELVIASKGKLIITDLSSLEEMTFE